MRPSDSMPRSLMRTITDRFVFSSTTRTSEPKGRVGWQAVMAYMSNRSPLAVRWPSRTAPYHEATPWSLSAHMAPADFLGDCAPATPDGFVLLVFKAGVALKTGEGGGGVEAGPGSRASACTGCVERTTTTAASATDEAPARIQIPSGVFKLMLRDFLRITICRFY